MNDTVDQNGTNGGGLRSFLRGFRRKRGGDGSARDTLDELIEERGDAEQPLDSNERVLLANILELRNITIADVMVPRADIIAVQDDADVASVIEVLTREGHSRVPVFHNTLDDAYGMVHIKDLLGWRGQETGFRLADIHRKLLFVAPSMRVLELLLEMRAQRSHMALVVDEFGGVDGLATIEDLVEEIVGEIEDEHDRNAEPVIETHSDNGWVADARVSIAQFEAEVGEILSDDERENIDTLGGLVFSMAGRVPIRGEIVVHPGGVEFEVLDADPRRIHRVLITCKDPGEDDPAAADE